MGENIMIDERCGCGYKDECYVHCNHTMEECPGLAYKATVDVHDISGSANASLPSELAQSEPPQDTSLDEQLMEVMLYVRTTHEVEHNDNQWAREFVYSFDEAKAKINRLIDDARLDERNKCIRELRGDDE